MENSKSIPSFYDLQSILTNEESAIHFLFDSGALYPQPSCASCHGPTKRKVKLWICIKKSCAKSISIFKGSFFSRSMLKCNQILFIAYLWLNRTPVTSIASITGHSSATITSFAKFLNQLLSDNVKEEECTIGGPEIIVEIDECKIAKRKFHRGHVVEGAWIIGGVERTPERRIFVELIEKRDSETIREILSRRVTQGSIVLTDKWRGYIGIESLGVEHGSVNHSRHFKDPQTGVHTNTIEGSWAGIKNFIPVRNRNKDSVEDHILSFIWRRQNEGQLWLSFIRALADTHYQ